MEELFFRTWDKREFNWWPVQKAFTPPEYRQYWKGSLCFLPMPGHGIEIQNYATPNGMNILNNNGYLEGTAGIPAWDDGFMGSWALNFDGDDNQLVRIFDDPNKRCLDLTDRVSVLTVIKPHETDDAPIIAKWGASTIWYLNITADPNNQLRAYVNGAANFATSARALNQDQWYVVGFTYDKKTIKVYIDGRLEGSTNYTTAMTVDGNTDITIGAHENAGGRYYYGLIGIVYIWNRVLEPQEMQALSRAVFGPVHLNTNTQVAVKGLGMLTQTLNDDMRMTVDAGDLARAAYTAHDWGNTGKLLQPIEIDMRMTVDAGTLHRATYISRSWGYTIYPYNINARGLGLRFDPKLRKFP